MRAFWWFKDNAIAGMARPGFNAIHWSDLPIEEAILFSWLGQYSSEAAPLISFRHHLETYAPKVFPFFRMTSDLGKKAMMVFDDEKGFLKTLAQLSKRTDSFRDFSIENDYLHVQLNQLQIQKEVNQLRQFGVQRLVTLTERHHSQEMLSKHLNLHHIAINDLEAPKHDQVLELARIIETAQTNDEIIAVHCLAGIGRTSTMLMAAHLHLGESFSELKNRLEKRNPTYILAGKQGEFIAKCLKMWNADGNASC